MNNLYFFIYTIQTSHNCSQVTNEKMSKSKDMKSIIRYLIKLLFGAAFLIFLIPGSSMGQECPSFRIKEVKNVETSNSAGEVVIDINGSRRYTQENFQIRQKQNHVTGEIGYDVDMKITRNELVISGLKKSEELYLDEYVILFSDKSCKNSAIVEVGTFKIK